MVGKREGKTGKMNIYMKNNRTGVDALGIYNPVTKECVVLKGSKVSRTLSTCPTFRGMNSVLKKRRETVENYIVKKNVSFSSCSTAGNYVTGRSTDGYRAWRVEDGRFLGEYLLSNTIDMC